MVECRLQREEGRGGANTSWDWPQEKAAKPELGVAPWDPAPGLSPVLSLRVSNQDTQLRILAASFFP